MNPVNEGQVVYAFSQDRVRAYEVRKVTAKQIKVTEVGYGYGRTFARHDGYPHGTVAVYSGGNFLWTTEDQAVLAEVQKINQEIDRLKERAQSLTEKFLGGAA